MALTRITKGVIKPNENYDTHNIVSTGIVTSVGLDVNGNADISGNFSVGGVLTYEDVTSIDSVGIITAQKDIHVGAGLSVVGVGSFGTVKVGTGITFETNGQGTFSGIVTSRGYEVSSSDSTPTHNYFKAGRIRIFDNGSHCHFRFGDHPSYAPHQHYSSNYVQRTNAWYLQNTAATRYGITWVNNDGPVNLWYSKGYAPDYSIKLSTTPIGVTVGTGVTIETNGQANFAGVSTFSGIVAAGIGSTAITLGNSHKITLGSAHELEMRHDGSNSYIKQRFFAYPSRLKIISENSGIDIMSGSGGNSHGGYENAISCENNGKVKIYHAGVGPALETNGDGVTVAASIWVGAYLKHNSDLDTKFGFPALDTISFDTAGSERLRIDSSGRLLHKHTASRNVGTKTGQLQVINTGNDATISIIQTNNAASAPFLAFGKTRSGNTTGSTIVQNNDSLGQILFAGADGTDVDSIGAWILAQVDGTPGSNDMPGRLIFSTTADGYSTPTERLRIDNTGALRINNTRTTATKLHVVGGTASGTAYDAAVFAGGQNSTSGSGVKLYLSGCENDPLSRGVVLESIMTDNANAHRFSVKVSGSSAAPIERFRIASDGTVDFYGNQTNAPNGIFGFRYDRSNDTDLSIENLDNGSVNNNAGIRLASNHGNIKLRYFNNGGFYIQNSSTGYLHYYVNGTSTLYIDSSGNISINNAATPPSSNGGIGKRLGIKSTLNNIIVGETTNSGNFGLILESRVTGRSGDARSSQIGLGNGVIDFYTAASGAGVTKRLEITSTGALQHTGTSGVSYFTGSSEYIFGSTNSSPPAGGYESKVQIQDYKTRSALTVAAYMNNAGGPFMTFLSSRSGTVGTLGTKCINNDNLGGIRFSGDNATNYNSVAFGAEIFGKAKSTPADGDTIIAGEIHFATGNENGGAVQDKMIITSLGKIQYGLHDSGLPHAVQARGFVIYPNNGSNNITTIRVSGLVSGCFIFQMGYYNSSGQGEGGFACAVSGYMTSTNQYTIDNIKAPYAHANSSISSINKQNSYFEFSITNSHSSYTGGGTIGIIGDQEMTITVTYSS